MDPLTMAFGFGAAAFGSYTTYLRFSSPDKLGKLEAMREKFGAGAGTAIHAVAYSIAPIVLGLILIVAGSNGHKLF
jgi:hypothetical protein